MGETLRIGIDLGGTKIAGLAFDGADQVVAQERIDTPRDDYDATIAAIAALVARLQAAGGARGSVGIGTPGSISPATGRIQNGNSVWLNGRPMQSDLRAILGRDVRMANDADCFALSEAHDGAGAGFATVFGIILGTGCGGGLVVRRQLVTGPHHTGGEWGHMPLPWPRPEEYPGPECWCGRRSCMETWVAGPSLARDHRQATGADLGAEEIEAAARAGDTAARASLNRHADRLARGLGVLVNTVDPHVFVLGGGLSEMAHLYDELPALIAPHVFGDSANVVIRAPVHGAGSGVRGAARLWDGE
jgi:fructokinase